MTVKVHSLTIIHVIFHKQKPRNSAGVVSLWRFRSVYRGCFFT